jgi:hypothetical protein
MYLRLKERLFLGKDKELLAIKNNLSKLFLCKTNFLVEIFLFKSNGKITKNPYFCTIKKI